MVTNEILQSGNAVEQANVVGELIDFEKISSPKKRGRKPKNLFYQDLNAIPDSSLLRLEQVLQLIPISKSTWYAGVRKGIYPKPIKLSEGSRATFYRAMEIKEFLRQIGNAPAGQIF
jgi:predicted DNA-binding transcriptional regulator AlpA